MKRRRFLTAAAAAGMAGSGALAAPALAQGKRELKMVTAWPRGFPGLGTAAERLARAIGEATEDKIAIKVHAVGELVSAREVFEVVASGAADLYHAPDYYFQDKSKAFHFFTTIPFGMTAGEMDAWIYYGDGQKLWDEVSGGFGIKPFLAGNSGVQAFGWFKKEIKSTGDFRGVRFRVSGLGGEVLRKFGAEAVTLPPNDILMALQADVIDAAEWVGPWNDLALGFHRVARNYYFPGVLEPSAAVCCGFNRKLWDGLTAGHKRIIAEVIAADNSRMQAEFAARNNEALYTLHKEHGIKPRMLPDDVVRQLGAAAAEVVASVGNTDETAKKVYESFIQFRKKAMTWSNVANQAVLAARQLSFKFGG